MSSDPHAVHAILAEAVKTEEIIRIVYHGGSQPGSARDVSPLVVTPHEMRAHDLAAAHDKLFLLAKVELDDPQAPAPAYDPLALAAVDDRSIGDALASSAPTLQALGWHVELSKNRISVHRHFKNGKPRKAAEASLGFYASTEGFTWEEPLHSSTRPYSVSSRNLAMSRSFGKLPHAVALFLDEVRGLSPDPATDER